MGQHTGLHSWCRVPIHSLTPPVPYKHSCTKLSCFIFSWLLLLLSKCSTVSPSIILSRGGKRIALHPQYHYTQLYYAHMICNGILCFNNYCAHCNSMASKVLHYWLSERLIDVKFLCVIRRAYINTYYIG